MAGVPTAQTPPPATPARGAGLLDTAGTAGTPEAPTQTPATPARQLAPSPAHSPAGSRLAEDGWRNAAETRGCGGRPLVNAEAGPGVKKEAVGHQMAAGHARLREGAVSGGREGVRRGIRRGGVGSRERE